MRAGHEDKAYEQFHITYRLDPQRNPPEIAMGVIHVTAGNFRKANHWFTRALAAYPEDARAHFGWSLALLHQDRGEEARRHARRAASLGMDTPRLAMHLGLIARQLEDYPAAEQHFARVLARAPDDLEAACHWAIALAEQDDPARHTQALERAQTLAQNNQDSVIAMTTLGWVFHRLGENDKAELALRSALQLPHVRAETLYYLGQVVTDQGDLDEARRLAIRLDQQLAGPGLFVLRPQARNWIAKLLR